MGTRPELDLASLRMEAVNFCALESVHDEPSMFGVTDGKAVGTYVEHKFQEHLHQSYTYVKGSSARGIDFPGLEVDMKVTSVKQPQSSSPFKSARQKVFGLGYHILIFVYAKTDDQTNRTSRLQITDSIFIDASRTADYQMTRGLRELVDNEANVNDIEAFLRDRNLPVDDIEATQIAEAVLAHPPNQGYLTISNALQWRLQYARVIGQAGSVTGIDRVV